MGLFSKKPANSVSNDTSPVTAPVTPPPTQTEEQRPVEATNQRPSVKKHSRSFSFVSILFLLTILGAGVMTYLWYNQTAQVDSLNNELSQAKTEISTLKQGASPSGGKDFVDQTRLGAIAESHHQANVTEGYQNTPYIVTIKYLDKDSNFARVHIEYVSSDQNLPKNTLTGKYDHYIFKNVLKKNGDKEWVMLAMNPIFEDDRKRLIDLYGVPAGTLDLTKEQPA